VDALKESRAVDQRLQFLAEYQTKETTIIDLCRQFGISRPTAYKWIKRYEELGPEGLLELSRRPKSCSHAIPEEIENEVLAVRNRHPTWGPRKIRARLEHLHPDADWPARSTIGQILNRAGLTKPQRIRRKVTPSSQPFGEVIAPNQVWCIDFKGWFRTGDGQRCDLLTITDAFSRYLIRCQVVNKMDTPHVMAVCDAAMREFGLPDRIRSDNGSPFSGPGLLGLSRLSLKWLRLGIGHERIQPGCPQQNGRHERMHRTLKEETARPPAATLASQQRRFNEFRKQFNNERPHEALAYQTPSHIYVCSARPYPNHIPDFEYGNEFLVRAINHSGDMSWHQGRVFISRILGGDRVGLLQISDKRYRVFYGPLVIGEFDQSDTLFYPRRSWDA
jgi:transposase InsO family protein